MGKSFQEIAENIQERIRQVAYLMWESAGRQHGMAMEYWLAAESDVLKTMQAAAESLMLSEAKENPKPAVPVAQALAAPVAEPVPAAPTPAVKPEAAKPQAAKPEAAKPAPRKTGGRAKANPS